MISQILLILQNSLIKLCLSEHHQLIQVLKISKNLYTYSHQNTPTRVSNSAAGKQTSKAPFLLPPHHAVMECVGIWNLPTSPGLLGAPGSSRHRAPVQGVRPGQCPHPWVPKMQQEQPPMAHRERRNCANESSSCCQAKLLFVCTNYPD